MQFQTQALAVAALMASAAIANTTPQGTTDDSPHIPGFIGIPVQSPTASSDSNAAGFMRNVRSPQDNGGGTFSLSPGGSATASTSSTPVESPATTAADSVTPTSTPTVPVWTYIPTISGSGSSSASSSASSSSLTVSPFTTITLTPRPSSSSTSLPGVIISPTTTTISLANSSTATHSTGIKTTPTTFIITTTASLSATPTPTPSSGFPSGSGNGTTIATLTGPCKDEGVFNCIDGTSYQQCASGRWSVVMKMPPTTTCALGQTTTLWGRSVRRAFQGRFRGLY